VGFDDIEFCRDRGGGACRFASSTEENPAAGMYAKYDCGQIAMLRGDVPNPKEHGTFRRDMDEIEAASKAKGCNIDFR
jgi:hypothetical protein